MMYDIVMKVVTPARISVRIVVCDSDSRKVFSRKSCIGFQSISEIMSKLYAPEEISAQELRNPIRIYSWLRQIGSKSSCEVGIRTVQT